MPLFALLLILVALAACSLPSPASQVDPGFSSSTSPYQLLVSSADLEPGTVRLVLSVWDGPQRLSHAQALDVAIYELTDEAEMGAKIWEGPATSYQMGSSQYWVLYPTFPSEGIYGVQATITDEESKRFENRALLQVKEQATAPSIGEAAPRSETRTLADAPVEELTSAPPYIDDFYRLSVSEAAQSGKLSVIVFATPGHCTSSLCAPVFESVRTLHEELGEAINVVHVEIYRDFASNTVEPAVKEWNLPSEPWVFVLNPAGTVAARLDSLIGTEELEEAVKQVMNQ